MYLDSQLLVCQLVNRRVFSPDPECVGIVCKHRRRGENHIKINSSCDSTDFPRPLKQETYAKCYSPLQILFAQELAIGINDLYLVQITISDDYDMIVGFWIVFLSCIDVFHWYTSGIE